MLVSLQDVRAKAPGRKKSPFIRMEVPVNLRPIFGSPTMRNFSSYVYITLDVSNGDYTLEEAVKEVKLQKRLYMQPARLTKRIAANVALEDNLAIRCIPLFIKKPVINIINHLKGDKYATYELQCYRRFEVADALRERESELGAWLAADPARRERWGNPAAGLQEKYAAIANAEVNVQYFRECIIRGFQLEPVVSRTLMLAKRYGPEKVPGTRNASRRNFNLADLRVERELFRYALGTFYDNVDPAMFGPFQKSLRERFGTDYDGMCAYLWDGSWISSQALIDEYLDPQADMKAFLDAHIIVGNTLAVNSYLIG